MDLEVGEAGSVQANKMDQDSAINLWTDLHRRGSGGHILEQNFLCKQDTGCHTQ